MAEQNETVWVFHADAARFASGVFHTHDDGLSWAREHGLTGVLTEYPVGVGAFEDAVARGRFTPSRDHHGTAEHVGRFSPAHAHIHVANGQVDGSTS